MISNNLRFLLSCSLAYLIVANPLFAFAVAARRSEVLLDNSPKNTASVNSNKIVSESSKNSPFSNSALSETKLPNASTSGSNKTIIAGKVNSSLIPMPARKPGQSATLLATGQWLLIGGQEGDSVSASIWIKSPGSDELSLLSVKLQTARAWHTATMLPDGKLLIFGGAGSDGKLVESTEIFDPAVQSIIALPNLGLPVRSGHTATLLTNGDLFIAGGISLNGEIDGVAEIWNPETKTGNRLNARLQTARHKHSSALLPNGDVLVWKGYDSNNAEIFDGEQFSLETRQFFAAGVVSPQEDSNPPYAVATLPREADIEVPVSTRIALRFSKPLRVGTVNATNFVLSDYQETVPAKVIPAENGMLVFVTPQQPLRKSTTYTLLANGAKDPAGFTIPPVSLSFTTVRDHSHDEGHDHGSMGQNNQAGDTHDHMQVSDYVPRAGQDDPEEWIPNANNLEGWKSKEPYSEKNPPLPLKADKGVTAVSGRVLTLKGKPLANVSLQVGTLSALTDETGRFLLIDVPKGKQTLVINGGTASTSNKPYAMFDTSVDVTEGITTVLPFNIWIPIIDTRNITQLPELTNKEVIATTPRIPGLEVRVPAGARLRYPRGNLLRNLTITPIPVNRPPFPLPAGAEEGVLFTLQLHSAKVEEADGKLLPGLSVIYPNAAGLPAGARVAMWNYNPRGQGWYIYGYGTVTEDKRQVIPDIGTELQSMHCLTYLGNPNNAPAEGPPAGGGADDGDPVDLQTGLFVYNKTDLMIPDINPITLTRTYRQRDTRSRSFGVGTTNPYEMYIVGTTGYQDIVLPDGGRIRYQIDGLGRIQVHTATPTIFYGSTFIFTGNEYTGYFYEVKLLDGTIYRFDAIQGYKNGSGAITNLRGIIDRYGNELKIEGNRITSPSGRWIELTKDPDNRITQAKDNSGRKVTYTYDTNGRLWKVIDPSGGVSEYAYDGFGQMLTIKDARGIVFLTNEYDTNGRVFRQTQADNTTYQFSYTLDTNGKVTQTDVTNPRGLIRRLTFNSSGYWSTDTSALGMSEQQVVSYERNTGNLPLKITDGLGRKTTYVYNSKGSVESVTELAETTGAATTTYTYEPVFNQVATITDPLTHTTTLGYNTTGDLISVTNPLSHQTTFDYNAKGQLISATDALNHTVQFTYQGADLTQIKDSLNRIMTRGYDDVGRLISITDPLGVTSRVTYNAHNLPVRMTDPRNGTTSIEYDANGNMLSITDARNGKTIYSYDNLDRLETRTDALTRLKRYAYDANGNIIRFTDRRNKVTTYRYDKLDRLSFAGYGTVGVDENAIYESTINYTYDAANRLTQTIDSASGTITRNYNDIGRTFSETTSQGIIGYAFDSAYRQTSMSVTGQPAVNYLYDNADRLTAITQGGLNVGFSYDNADRQTSLTLPNGVVVQSDYDNASQVTGLTYKLGAATLGDLTYGYDAAGRRISMGGSFAKTLLPQPMTAASYDATNKLTQRGAVSFTYDNNGNLAGDGTNSYTWNARNELTSMSGSVSANFVYDAFGRRTQRTIGGQTTKYLYEGANIVQEQSVTNTPVTNLLNGGIDQIFARTATSTNTTHTPITDAQGSTMALLDAAGVKTTGYNYEPFGKTTQTGADGGSNKFTGREDDGTGLYFYRARYYSPDLQRFISEDPIGFAGGDTNLYAYVGNNPISYTDASGLHRQDRWYGFNDVHFQDWVHQVYVDAVRAEGQQQLTKEQVRQANAEWKAEGSPRLTETHRREGRGSGGGGRGGGTMRGLLGGLNLLSGLAQDYEDYQTAQRKGISFEELIRRKTCKPALWIDGLLVPKEIHGLCTSPMA